MSRLPKKQLHPSEDFSKNDSNATSKNYSREYEPSFIQHSPPLSNDLIRASLVAQEIERMTLSQQARKLDVKVNLVDCMKCYVRIPRCKVEEEIQEKYMDGSNSNSKNELDCIVQEYREEQEKVPQKQQNSTSLQEAERLSRTYYYDDPYLEDLNPMNRYTIIDLPWPQSLEK